jgi:hypothetical protein
MLSEKEIMKSSWISLNLQMQDFPFYDYKAEKRPIKITDPQQAADMMARFSNNIKG